MQLPKGITVTDLSKESSLSRNTCLTIMRDEPVKFATKEKFTKALKRLIDRGNESEKIIEANK
jgi:hypothetical protein